MSRAVDCFAVCGLSASPVTVSGDAHGFVGAEERYLPELLSSYPSTSSAGNNEDVGSVLAQLALMSMPEGVDVHIRDPPKEALPPRMYPLVLTEPDGALVHVMCLSFLEPVSDAVRAAHPALRSACARKCLCLVSRARTPMSALRAILRAVHRTCFVCARRDAPPLADVVAALVDGVPFPERGAPPALVTVLGRPMVVPAADDDDDASDDEGRVTSEGGEIEAVTPRRANENGNDDARRAAPTSIPAWDASATDAGFEPLVRALDERNAVRAACAVAEERRVLLRSRNDALLVSASAALLRTLRPMRWRHAFAPLLPISLAAATLEKSKGPFIVGVKADFVVPKAALENAVVVDLDANDVREYGSAESFRGFPRAFAEPLLADLRRLASREPRDAADVADVADGDENENDAALPEWARVTAYAAAARAAARGRRWSAHHDDAVGESFRAFWRRCFRGYRSFLRAEPNPKPAPGVPAASPGGKGEKSDGFDAGVFDAAGFYKQQAASKDRGTREAASFVRLVAASAAFEAHAGSQIRAAKRREAEEEQRGRPRVLGGEFSDDRADRGGEAAARPPWTSDVDAERSELGRGDGRALFDALLDEDSDERLALGPAGPGSGTRGNERKVRGGGFFGTSATEKPAAEPEYLRAGSIVRAGSRRLLSARKNAGRPAREKVVSVTFRTAQSSGASEVQSFGSSPRASIAVGDGFTSTTSAAGPAAHALALSGESSGFAPRAPAYPRARVPPIDPPAANAASAGARGAVTNLADPRGVVGSPGTPAGLGSALDARNLDLLERRKQHVRRESSAFPRGGSRSPEHGRLDSERGRSASPRRSPPFRRNSVDAFAGVFSNPGSATGSRGGYGAGDGRFGDDSEDERDELEPSDATTGLNASSPEKSRPRRSGSGKHLGLSFIFGARRSRRKSEANPLHKVEQAKREVWSRGGSAHAGQAYARDARRTAQSVGSAEELAARGKRRADGRAASVLAFDGWLAAAGDGVARVKKETNASYGSDRSDPVSSAGESEDERAGRPHRFREPLKHSSPSASPRRPDERKSPRAGFAEAAPATSGAAYAERTGADAAHVLSSHLRELWALASADASISARAAVAAAAIRAVPSPFAPEGAAFAAAAAAELAATDLAGVALALEGGGAVESDRRGRSSSPLLKAGVALMSLEEEHGESSASPAAAAAALASPLAAPPTAAERKMKAAEAAGRAASVAADEAAARARRAEEAAAIAATPGALAVVHAAAAAAAAVGDASLLLRVLAVARVPSSSSSFSEHLTDADPSAEESFDPAVAVANGDVGRVLCRLPGGAALWGDVRTWRGIESARVAAGGAAASEPSQEWLFHPGEPPTRRRRALAAAMAATGLPPHAVAELLAQLGPPPASGAGPTQGAARRGGGDAGAQPGAAGAGGLEDGIPQGGDLVTSRSVTRSPETHARLGRSTARVWSVPVTSRARPGALAAEPAGSGPGDAVAHDGYVERARGGLFSAPDWAADETTRGVGRRKPFALALASESPIPPEEDDERVETDVSDDEADCHVSRRSPALLPGDARRAKALFAAPVTVVAARLTSGARARGGLVAAGSATGAFAVWDPVFGDVVRPRPGEWGAQSAGSSPADRRFAHSAITALCFLSDAGAEEEEELWESHARPARALVLGGTRGGGVAAWDVVKGACVLANPGSHAGAVTVAAAAPGGAGLAPGPAAGAAFGPTIALTASDAPGDGFVRLWDARAGPRQAAAALAGHTGGVTAVSPRWRLRGGGGGGGGAPLAGRSGAFLTGDGAGVVRAWDWRRAAGGALASARAHVGAVTAVTPLDDSRTDVAGSAGEDGAVRAVALDGGGGRGIGGGFGGGRGCLIGHLGPVRALAAVRGVDAPGAGNESVYQSLADEALAAGAYAADGGAGGAADATLLRAGGLGLVSGGDDGAVRLWAPGSFGVGTDTWSGEDSDAGSSWSCVGRAHAHGGGVCLVEVGKSSRRGVGVVTAAEDGSLAAWSAPSPAALGVASSWGAPGGGGGVDVGHAPYRSFSSNTLSASFAPFGSVGGDDRGFRGGRASPRRFAGPSGSAAAGVRAARSRDAGWAPVRMHHRPTRKPPRALAVDPGGGRLVSGFHDGSLTCATLPGWGSE